MKKTPKSFPRTPLQKLLTAADLKRLPKMYATEKTPEAEKVAVVKYFCGPATWYAVEFDGEDQFFGFVTGLAEDEWGYFSLRELASLQAAQPLEIAGRTRHIPLRVERDIHWKPQPMSKAIPSRFATKQADDATEAAEEMAQAELLRWCRAQPEGMG
ncbi:MAG: DUF2958 domain-containing protein, partial [Cystobacter sp.]